ncbi:hypothetical protein [uncultured Aquimarina sp.]|uniref:hypothetical protein n=1 Tax=uncultured Aquimarina sp. TaxID=575652 RepID=UPI00262EBAD2|nr:hypothetical protein [uncultured Aquimarina sp.]
MTEKDTINCYIIYDEGYSGFVSYKLNKTDKKILKIKTSEIQNINVGTDRYDKIEYKGSKYLMKVLCEGIVSLYEYKRGSSNSYNSTYSNDIDNNLDEKLITTSSFNISSDLKKSKLYITKDNAVIKVKKNKIKNRLKELMKDQKDFHEKIDKLKPRDFLFNSELKSVICNYNFWIKKNT